MNLLHTWYQRLKKIILWTLLIFFIWSIGGVLTYRFINPPFTYLMIKRTSQQIAQGKTVRFEKHWKKLSDISPNLVQAVVAAEDNNFVHHFGIDMDAVRDALHHNERSHRIHGASTITQQTAKNVFLWPQRSYLRKGIEFYYTILMETFWSKRRIMEVYLNVIEMGNGIYGAEAASRCYFKKPASRLSMGESALIAGCLPAPRKRNPGNPSLYMIRRQERILNIMYKIGPVNFR